MEAKVMKSGIYKIQNLNNGKVYIGSTTNFQDRFKNHKNKLNRNSHFNDYLQKSWNKHGGTNFKFEILLYCSKEDLEFYEQRAIDEYNACNRSKGYNLIPQADRTTINEETKQKISESVSGENNPFYGKVHDEETRKLISENTPDNGIEPPTYWKEDHPLYGKERSEECKEKIGKANRGENGHSKLTKKEVEEIKEKLFKENNPHQGNIAENYNVSSDVISNINCGNRWSHVGEYNYPINEYN